MLRIAAGLITPTSGEVLYRRAPLRGPAAGISVVFQSLALYPWLTVIENVEAGLEAATAATRRDAPARRGRDRSDRSRWISGGIPARALGRYETACGIDVLTAETLRTDFLDLWIGHKLPLQTALLVTHNIEEAVLLCDRILVLSSNPGRICSEIPISLSHPRDRLSAEFRSIVDQIYSILTLRSLESIRLNGQAAVGVALPLPPPSINQISGLLETLLSPPHDGHAQLADLARKLALEADDLFPIAEAVHILGFAQLAGGSLRLTAAGRVFADSSTEVRKRLWKEHLLQFVPLVAHIHHVLEERSGYWAPRSRFETELEDHLTHREAERTLRAAIGWGRHAELFAYAAKLRRFTSHID